MKGTVLITGASAGFGASTAKRFGREGWNLVLVARRMERLQALRQELESACAVYPAAVDVRDREQVRSLFHDLPPRFEAVDILVNNAGVGLGSGPAYEGKLDDWDATVDTNIKGLLYFTRAVLQGMLKRNRGHIINVGSIAGSWPYPDGNVYAASKAFVNHFSRNLRADLFGSKVRVSNIEPGLAETEFALVRHKGDAGEAQKVYEGMQPLTAEDIAEAIYWVAGLPPHVDVTSLEIMPTDQSWAPFAVARDH